MRVRKLGLGALAWRGGSLNGGEVGDVPVDVVERYAHKLEILDPMPAAEAVVTEVPVSTSTGEERRLTSVKPKAKPRARKRKSR